MKVRIFFGVEGSIAGSAAAEAAAEAAEGLAGGQLRGGAEAELGHAEQVDSLHEVAAEEVAGGGEAGEGGGLFGFGAGEEDEDVGVAHVGADDDVDDIDALDAGVGELEADELAEFLAHGFGDAAAAEFVHGSVQPIDGGGDEGGTEEEGGGFFGGLEDLGGVFAGGGDGDGGDD